MRTILLAVVALSLAACATSNHPRRAEPLTLPAVADTQSAPEFARSDVERLAQWRMNPGLLMGMQRQEELRREAVSRQQTPPKLKDATR